MNIHIMYKGAAKKRDTIDVITDVIGSMIVGLPITLFIIT